MKIVKIEEERIEFDDGTVMESYHEQDCCEWHWAELGILANYNLNPKTGETINIKDIEFPDNIDKSVKLIPGEGFNLVAKDGSKYFVPCYASNNGYYSTNLKLLIRGGKFKKNKSINLEECQKDKEYIL